MIRWYLDASVGLHAVLPWGDPRAREWLESMDDQRGALYSSTVLQLEIVRALRRERLDIGFSRLVLDRVELVSIDDGVLRVAGSIEPHMKSLDAIHLATCSMLGSGVTVVTHDRGMAAAAVQLGFDTLDPLSSAPGE